MDQRSAGRPRRRSVGVMTGSFHTDYSRRIAQELSRALHEADRDVFLFQGLDASRFLNLSDYVDPGFDRHYYSQFEYSKFLSLDALIISFGTISPIPDAVSLEEFLAELPQVPVILLEDEHELSNGCFITVDNYTGMRDCVEHLIEDHGYRSILYVSGPSGVSDAEVRLRAFLDSMAAHGLPVPETAIGHGNFTDRVDPVIETLLEANPRAEAIVCGNDEMAESAYRVLRRRGLTPGVDIAVTGFDDNISTPFMDPPLTSVRQSCREIADRTAQLVTELLDGHRPKSVRLPARLVRRSSCGCREGAVPTEGSEKLHEEHGWLMSTRLKNKQLTNNNMLSALMLRNLLHENISVHLFFEKLGMQLAALKTETSLIALLREPMNVSDCGKLFLPEEVRVHMVQMRHSVQTWARDNAPLLTAGEGNPFQRELDGAGLSTCVFPLFYSNIHYGVFMVSIRPEDMLFYYTLSLEIGTGLRYLYMALDQQETRKTLEQQNQILDFSASHDALTGLYNRVAILKHAYGFIRESGRDSQFAAFMADVDHLKQINDSFGHGAGDEAIQTAAELLRAALPEGSPLGRTGGDEFTGIFRLRDDFLADDFKHRLSELCRAYNAASGKPWYEELSAGCKVFSYEQADDLMEHFKQADAELYKAKAHRRSSVVRPEKTP